MTATTVRSGRTPSRLAAIFGYTLRSCLPARRRLTLLVPCVMAVLFGLLALAVDDTPDAAFANVAAEGILSLVVPIAALMIGDAVLGAEVRAGTFHFTWLSPAPTWQIVIGRWLGGSLVAVVMVAPSCALAAVVAGDSESAWPVAVAAAMESVSYIALFIAIGCLTRRTAVWSLAVVFFVERLLGANLSAIAQVSPMWEGRAIFVGLLDDPPDRLVRDGIPHGVDAIVRLAIFTAVALAVAVWRMRRLRLSGATD